MDVGTSMPIYLYLSVKELLETFCGIHSEIPICPSLPTTESLCDKELLQCVDGISSEESILCDYPIIFALVSLLVEVGLESSDHNGPASSEGHCDERCEVSLLTLKLSRDFSILVRSHPLLECDD